MTRSAPSGRKETGSERQARLLRAAKNSSRTSLWLAHSTQLWAFSIEFRQRIAKRSARFAPLLKQVSLLRGFLESSEYPNPMFGRHSHLVT